jgi:hypothetical protein
MEAETVAAMAAKRNDVREAIVPNVPAMNGWFPEEGLNRW